MSTLFNAPSTHQATAPQVSVAVVAPNSHVQPISVGPAPLTVEEFKAALPDKVKRSVSQALIDAVNATLSNPEEFEHYRDNLLSYAKVMQEGKFKIEQYLAAVKYVGYKLMGKTNKDSYILTFPDKMANFTAQGVSAKDIASYCTAYNKSKLVNLIFEQTLVPAYVLNQDLFQKALNTQAELMLTAKSEKVRSDAANSLLTHLKMPEVSKVELDVKVSENSAITELRKATQELAAAQRLAVQSGSMTAQQVAHSRVVMDVVDVESREVQ